VYMPSRTGDVASLNRRLTAKTPAGVFLTFCNVLARLPPASA